jgi:hypothetical protein
VERVLAALPGGVLEVGVMTVDIPVEIWAVVQVEMREVPVLQVRVAVVVARLLSSVSVVA